jgi:hypothetical protein
VSHVATLGLKPAAIPAAPTAASPFTRAYTRYAMGLLLAIYIVNFLDRTTELRPSRASKSPATLGQQRPGQPAPGCYGTGAEAYPSVYGEQFAVRFLRSDNTNHRCKH